jgi:prepilin-type N-terminal cleavage/methylation domain-containing protein
MQKPAPAETPLLLRRNAMYRKLQPSTSGFTLVELAIVITIIGLLIGGILKGQEMIVNAKVSATISQVQGYQAAYETFRDRFDNLPGDFPRATTRLPGCSTAAGCYNGDGNGRIGASSNASHQGVNTAINAENTQFWKHMAMADLIAGVSPAATTLSWGRTHPSAPIAGGFHVGTVANTTYGTIVGTILILRNDINGAWLCGVATSVDSRQCAISPRDGGLIDRKMDDGTASTGYVQAGSASGFTSGCGEPNQGVNGPSGYQETSRRLLCDMFFRL